MLIHTDTHMHIHRHTYYTHLLVHTDTHMYIHIHTPTQHLRRVGGMRRRFPNLQIEAHVHHSKTELTYITITRISSARVCVFVFVTGLARG
jgi:hypothetical protein